MIKISIRKARKVDVLLEKSLESSLLVCHPLHGRRFFGVDGVGDLISEEIR